jgi:hypothetical protein
MLYSFISGAIMLACLVAAGFFYRFYRRTSDRLFAWFAVSFLLLAFERCSLAVINAPETTSPLIYVPRLIAFVAIIIAVVDKNRSG